MHSRLRVGRNKIVRAYSPDQGTDERLVVEYVYFAVITETQPHSRAWSVEEWVYNMFMLGRIIRYACNKAAFWEINLRMYSN